MERSKFLKLLGIGIASIPVGAKLLKAEAEVPEIKEFKGPIPVKLNLFPVDPTEKVLKLYDETGFMIHDTVIYPYHGDPEPFVITAITERYFELTPVRHKTWNGLKLQKIHVIKDAAKKMIQIGSNYYAGSCQPSSFRK